MDELIELRVALETERRRVAQLERVLKDLIAYAEGYTEVSGLLAAIHEAQQVMGS